MDSFILGSAVPPIASAAGPIPPMEIGTTNIAAYVKNLLILKPLISRDHYSSSTSSSSSSSNGSGSSSDSSSSSSSSSSRSSSRTSGTSTIVRPLHRACLAKHGGVGLERAR